MTLRILNLDVHQVQAWMECRMWREMGYEVLSFGTYTFGGAGDDRMRPAIDLPYNARFAELANQCTKEKLLPEMLDLFDVVIAPHPSFFASQWGLLNPEKSGKRVIWRAIGQSVARDEQLGAALRKQGMEIIRYSPTEQVIPSYAGHDAIIPFGLPVDEYLPWTGQDERAVAFIQNVVHRGTHCGWPILEPLLAAGTPIGLYGPSNEAAGPAALGMLSYAEQLDVLSRARCVLALGTHPAPITLNFLEGWLSGAPVIAAGPVAGHPMVSGYAQGGYWVSELITQGVDGFLCDSPAEFAATIATLIKDPDLAREVGIAGQAKARSLFSYEAAKPAWASYLGGAA